MENLEKDLNGIEYKIHLLVAFQSSIIAFPRDLSVNPGLFQYTTPVFILLY
jgi:hypothetical protein